MPFFDRIKQGGDATKFKADQLIRVQRVQSEISSINKEIEYAKDRLANLAIDLHQRGELADQRIEEVCLQIDQLLLQIAEKNNQIASIRAEELPQAAPTSSTTRIMKVCPNCKASVAIGALFCSECGNEMAVSPEGEQFVCGSCHNNIRRDAQFCPNCGRQVV